MLLDQGGLGGLVKRITGLEDPEDTLFRRSDMGADHGLGLVRLLGANEFQEFAMLSPRRLGCLWVLV